MVRTPLRRCAALIAAYAVALQVALSGVVVVPLNAVADAGIVICRGDNPEAPAAPAAHEPCGACLAGHCAGASADPDRMAIGVPWPSMHQSARIALRIVPRSPDTPRHGPHAPRAPPSG